MAKYRYVFFDLDGTLTDSAEGITKSVAYALEKFGIIVSDLSKLNRFVGPPLKEAFMRFYGLSQNDAIKAVEYYRERFRDVGIFENKVYDGIPQLLEKLNDADCKLIIATSKPEVFANRILEHFNLTKYFSVITGATLDGKISSKTEVLKYAFTLLGDIEKKHAIMIGDRYHDIDGARDIGIDSIGVLYGYGNLDELEKSGATFIAETPDKICDILLN